MEDQDTTKRTESGGRQGYVYLLRPDGLVVLRDAMMVFSALFAIWVWMWGVVGGKECGSVKGAMVVVFEVTDKRWRVFAGVSSVFAELSRVLALKDHVASL